LKYGEFGMWLKNNVPFSQDSAEVYMLVFKHRSRIRAARNLREALDLARELERAERTGCTETKISNLKVENLETPTIPVRYRLEKKPADEINAPRNINQPGERKPPATTPNKQNPAQARQSLVSELSELLSHYEMILPDLCHRLREAAEVSA
jgi:hypothetical protein